MRAFLVIPSHPGIDPLRGFFETAKLVLPHARFFETAKEAFNQPVLLRGIRRNKFLRQAVVATGSSKPLVLEKQSVVTTQDRCGPNGTQCAEASKASRFDGPLSFLSSATSGKLIAHNLAIMTIDDGRQMPPAVLSTGDMGHIHGPAMITLRRPTPTNLHTRAWGGNPLMH